MDTLTHTRFWLKKMLDLDTSMCYICMCFAIISFHYRDLFISIEQFVWFYSCRFCVFIFVYFCFCFFVFILFSHTSTIAIIAISSFISHCFSHVSCQVFIAYSQLLLS